MSASTEENVDVSIEDLLSAAKPHADDLVDRTLHQRTRAILFGEHAPMTLGRLELQKPIGSGAMGTVFAAYDPTLDRQVAVKVLHTTNPRTHDRILREARALAKLEHPHIVRIYDAATVDGVAHIVMELVDGPSLREWVAGGQPRLDTIEALHQAALGLQYAHTQSVIHSDIKPENILMGPRGAKVADFGTAIDATRVQAAGHTPAYASPERAQGGPPTYASDQYAFAVLAHECLLGSRPDDPQRTAGWRGLPRSLRATILRCLSHSPASRFPTMGEVAENFDWPARRRRRVRRIAFIAVFAAVVLPAVAFWLRPATDPCANSDDAKEMAWDDGKRRLLVEQLTSVNAPFANESTSRIVESIDSFVTAWKQSRRHVCEATHLRGVQSDERMDVRMACLDSQQTELAAWVEALMRVESSRELAAATHPLTSTLDPFYCRSVDDRSYAVLASERARREHQQNQRRIADAHALFTLGRYEEARESAKNAGIDANTDPLSAASQSLLEGMVTARVGSHDAAQAHFQTALSLAATHAAGRTERIATVEILRAHALSDNPLNAIAIAPLVRATAARTGGNRAKIDAIVGEAYRHAGQLAPAERLFDHALQDVPGLTGIDRALALMNRGSVRLQRGNAVDAEADFDLALKIAFTELGPDHPGTALYLDKRGQARLAQERTSEAEDDLRRALELRETAYGTEDRATASTTLHLGHVLRAQGRNEEARTRYEHALRIRTSVYGVYDRRTIEARRWVDGVIAAHGK